MENIINPNIVLQPQFCIKCDNDGKIRVFVANESENPNATEYLEGLV